MRFSISELQSNAESRVDIVEKTLNPEYRGRSWTECRVQNNGTLHGECKMKGPTDGRDFSHSKYAKMTGPADGVQQACCRVEQTRWRSWTDSLQNWTRSIENKFNKLAAELSRRTEFDEQRHRVELDVSRTIEYDVTRKICEFDVTWEHGASPMIGHYTVVRPLEGKRTHN